MNASNPSTIIFDSTAELQQGVAEAAADLILRIVDEKGIARISLSGGSTPRRIYELMAERDLPWDKIHWFWGDERNVLADSNQSNQRMVRETLLKNHHLSDQVHPVEVNPSEPETTAAEHEVILRKHFENQTMPEWDLILLGLGDDAHTASLFPKTKALDEEQKWFVHNWVEKLDTYRYTLTAPAINSGKNIWFLVAGESKRQALGHVWSGPFEPNEYPSQLIHPTTWYITRDAKP